MLSCSKEQSVFSSIACPRHQPRDSTVVAMGEEMADILVTEVGGSTQQGKRMFCVCCSRLTLDLGLAPQGTLLTGGRSYVGGDW